MKDHWLVWTSAIDGETCDKIIQQGLELKSDIGVIGQTGIVNKEIRSSTVSWFEDRKVPWIVEIIKTHVAHANIKNFGFDISHGINGIQFSSYSDVVSGRYDWHVDTYHTSIEPSDRKLSFCLQLSDPDTYEGGEFEFRGCDPLNYSIFKPRGSILVFPSIFEHRVLPVTKGVRYSLVSWIEGPKFR